MKGPEGERELKNTGNFFENIHVEAAKERIVASNKFGLIGKLAGMVLHELNSPMTSVTVFSEALTKRTEEGSLLHDHAQEIFQSAQRCRHLIQCLLRFAFRPQSRQKEQVSLAPMMAEIQQLLKHPIELAQMKLCVDIPKDLLPITGCVGRLEQMLIELLLNAMDACVAGDVISVKARYLEKEQQVELLVVDPGQCMDSAELISAKVPFFSTKPTNEAAGLGLTTCESIVAEMGGSLELESERNQGTTVRVRLPASVI
ncbi:MAG: HAMP domain-containing sensor histidine kinase [Pseudomonadota bacterium]